MKLLATATLFALTAFSTAGLAAEPPPPPPGATQRIAELKVESVKPGLTARHELYVSGFTQQKPVGDYQWKSETTVRQPADAKSRGFVRIKLVGTALGSAALIKGMPADFKARQKVEVPELKDKRGEWDVEVVDAADKVLFQCTIKT